jgi:hypothetical protein
MGFFTNLSSSVSFWFDLGVTLAATVSGIYGGIVYARKTDKLAERHDAEISPKFQQQQNIINDCLVALRVRTNADRIKIGQFHNGGKFLDGSPMKRFSITHESCDMGVPFEGANLQNIVVTILWDLISYVKQNDTKLWYTRDLPEGHFRSYNKSHGIDAFMVLPIRKHDLITGFVMVEWCDLDKIPDTFDVTDEVLKEFRSTIEVELLLR